MRIQIVSDLHLSLWPFELPATGADVVVVAGDVARPREAIAWLTAIPGPVLYVAGNHEFYGGSIDGTRAELARLAAGTNVRFLDDGEVEIAGVRFLGNTLWTDFRLFGSDGPKRERAITETMRFVRDFTRIRAAESGDRLFTPDDSTALFDAHARWLRERLGDARAGPTVVITHHAPSPSSIHPRFADSLVNVAFASDLTDLLDGARVRLWIHGHMHDSFDYVENGTRVVCNPRGYAKGGVEENRAFDPAFVVSVE
ncbi:MAG TPA: metallophosphoesterase [Casimicrobiaceae bacterium]